MATHTFFCIDGHTLGSPVRLVTGGAPRLEGADQSARRAHFMAEFDWIRRALMYEPRGHDAMSGAILMPPTRDDCDAAVLFIETSGCLPMCGHGTIGTITFALEHGHITPATPGIVRLEAPAGVVEARYRRDDAGRVAAVEITNVPSFLLVRDHAFESRHFGRLKVDVAYGGNFYPILEAQENYRDMADLSVAEILALGRELRDQFNDEIEAVHPDDPTIRGFTHFMWTGAATVDGADGRNAVIYGETGIDRSPCGTGTSARVAQRVARGLLDIGEAFVHESILGGLFTGRAASRTTVGGFDAVVPTVEGRAFVTGFNTIFVDDRDPFVHGFRLV